jgi:hypothetical protein
MFTAFPAFSSCGLTAPAAYVSRFHSEAHDATALCAEPPDPDHDSDGLSVNSVTGAPCEFSQVSQWTFVATWYIPIEKPELALDITQGRRSQKRALGQIYRSPSKMRGRS